MAARSKRDRLEKISKKALKTALEWMWWRNQAGDDWRSLTKAEAADVIGSKLKAEEVDRLIDGLQADEPWFSPDLLAEVFGLPSKDAMLASRTHAALRDVMESLEEEGRVMTAWRSLKKWELEEYLKAKFSARDLAGVLGIVGEEAREDVDDEADADQDHGKDEDDAEGAPATHEAVSRQGRARNVDAPPGARFGSYLLIRRLHGGGMSDAWEGRTDDGMSVFVKRVRDNDAPILHALQREQRIYQRLEQITAEHRHLLRVYDWVHDDGFVGLVTEFADGGDLAGKVERGGQMAPFQAAAIAEQVIDGLLTLHRNDIVHRDIKPHNVLFARSHWRIADFGIAKNLNSVMTRRTMAQMGTRAYMSPEQEEGRQAAPAMDIFSFGKVLAYLLTGQTDPDAIPYPRWRDLACRCTERDPTRRPTAADVVAWFQQVDA